MAAVRHLGFSKTWFLINGLPWAVDCPSRYQIWCKNVDRRQIMAEKRNSRWRPPPSWIYFRWLFWTYSGRPPSWILKSYRKSAVDWDIGTKFCMVVEINSGKSTVWQKYPPEVNSSWRRPPFWISFLGHNLSVDRHVCTKFGTVMENQQSKAIWGQLAFFFENPTWRTAAILNLQKLL